MYNKEVENKKKERIKKTNEKGEVKRQKKFQLLILVATDR